MLQIGICDDSAESRALLRSILERHLERRGSSYRIFEFSSGQGLLQWFGKHAGEMDLLFLDIEMQGVNGMETARALRVHSQTLQIVFVTGYAQYVFDGYTVGALDYLMKPVTGERIEQILVRAFAALQRGAEAVFLCRNADGLYRIPRKDILYFFSDRRQVTCVTRQRSFPFYAKLDEVQEQLGANFVRIHQRFLVQAQAVTRIGDHEVQIGETVLPVSRSCKAAALLALTRAMLDSPREGYEK